MAIMLTKKAEDKVKEILSEQPEPYAGLRIQVVGGGLLRIPVPHGLRQELQRSE